MKKGGIFDGPNALGLYSDALGETYTIRSGDNLTAIAKRYGHTAAELCSHNKTLGNVKDCNVIYAGKTLDIPDEWLGKAAEKKGATTGSQTPQNTMGPSDQPNTQQGGGGGGGGGGAAQPSGPVGPTSLAQKQTIFSGLPDVALYAIGAALVLGVVFVMLKKPKKPQGGPSVVVQAAANRRRARRNGYHTGKVVRVRLRTGYWNGTYKAKCDESGNVTVYDSVAGYYTTQHPLTQAQVRYVRSKCRVDVSR